MGGLTLSALLRISMENSTTKKRRRQTMGLTPVDDLCQMPGSSIFFLGRRNDAKRHDGRTTRGTSAEKEPQSVRSRKGRWAGRGGRSVRIFSLIYSANTNTSKEGFIFSVLFRFLGR